MGCHPKPIDELDFHIFQDGYGKTTNQCGFLIIMMGWLDDHRFFTIGPSFSLGFSNKYDPAGSSMTMESLIKKKMFEKWVYNDVYTIVYIYTLKYRVWTKSKF